MISFLIAVAVVVSAIWVYWDATSNSIGKIEGGKGLFNMSAGAWSLVTLFLWIVGFPAYLVKRGDLIEIARENPVKANGRGGKMAALTLAGAGFIVMSVGIPLGVALPSCSSEDTIGLVGQIVSDIPLVRLSGAQFVAVKDSTELGYNDASEIRSCAGTLVTTAGEDQIQYSVQWISKSKGTFSVNAQIVGL